MDAETHRLRHVLLHKHLDELFADFILKTGGRSTSTIFDLIKWSHQQTIKPDHDEENQ